MRLNLHPLNGAITAVLLLAICEPTAARFHSADPVPTNTNNGANFNRYNYASDNPYRFTDPDGRWPTKIHEKIIDKAFPGLTQAQRSTLKTASSSMDSVASGGQSQANSYQHSMRAPSQSPADAKQASGKFISGQETSARTAQGKIPSTTDGLKTSSLTAAGNAIHAATDGTSPAHTDSSGNPMVWGGIGHPIDAMQHSAAESDISSAQMDAAVNAAQGIFRATYGNNLYQQAIKRPEQ